MSNSKNLAMEDIIDSIMSEEAVNTSLKPGTNYFDTPCPEATKNKNIKIPKNIRDTEFKSKIEKPKKNKKVPSFYEEDEEEISEETLKAKILNLFSDFAKASSGILFDDILFYFQSNFTFKNSIRLVSKALQDLINKGILIYDDNTKRVYPGHEEDEEEEMKEFNSELKEKIIDLFDSSASGSVSGLKVNDIIKEFKPEYSRAEIIDILRILIKDNILTKGANEGTLIINSIEEDEEGSLIPSSNLEVKQTQQQKDTFTVPTVVNNQNQEQKEEEVDENNPNILTNVETPESLKQKGYKETEPGVFVSPDNTQKFMFTSPVNNVKTESFILNNNTMKFGKYDPQELIEETAQILNEMESGDWDSDYSDKTAGLDEFEDEDVDDEVEELDDEDVTITLTKRELEAIRPILSKLLNDVEEDEIDEDEIDELEEDEPIDDLSTDEEANADLIEDEDEEVEELEEDEESVADVNNGSVYDGSAVINKPTSLKKGTPAYDKKGRPITSKPYTPNQGQVDDGSSVITGGPKMKKHTSTYNNGKNPVNSRLTTAARGSKDFWNV